jgi:selenocysteine lyase/cysteine desulfurase
MSHSSIDDSKYSMSQLEDVDCGTTYVETEHYQHDDCGEMDRDDGTTTKNQLFSIYNNMNDTNDDIQIKQDGASIMTIESLRDAIASDVITYDEKDSPYTMIVSPYERSRKNIKTVPCGKTQDVTSLSNSSKYYTIPIIYCDQTASNRPMRSIEKYIELNCLPYYGNTHTNTSITGSQSTAYVGEARQIVAEVTNAKITGKASCDIVLFTGHGTTSVIELFIDCINIKEICRNCSVQQTPRPVVFIGPYEHHSNLIPWRETGCEIVMIPENTVTQNVDLDVLEEYLKHPKYDTCPMKIGTFTAASNVTGKLCPVDRIAAMLHTYQALAVFDYATASSYTKIDMNPMRPTLSTSSSSSFDPNHHDNDDDTNITAVTAVSSSLIAKDAVFISPHKMIGGVGTPGVLIIKKHLVSPINAPNRSGGGTVFYVTPTHH